MSVLAGFLFFPYFGLLLYSAVIQLTLRHRYGYSLVLYVHRSFCVKSSQKGRAYYHTKNQQSNLSKLTK